MSIETLPTRTAEAIARASNVDTLCDKPHLFKEALGHFQRLSLVAEYEVAVRALAPHINGKISSQQEIALKLIHDISKKDILGLAVEAMLGISTGKGTGKDRVAASAVLNEMYGEKNGIKDTKLTDALVMNLVGKG